MKTDVSGKRKKKSKVPPWWDDQAQAYARRIRFSLNFWSHGYYLESGSPVPDSIWERYFTYINKLEEEYPGIVVPYSPTQNVGCCCIKCKPQLYSEEDARVWAELLKSNGWVPAD